MSDIKLTSLDDLRARRFTSLAAVSDYLEHDRIQCLICGKYFKSLNAHLSRLHGISTRGYKEALNIPISKFLASPNSREKSSLGNQNEESIARLLDPQNRSLAASRALDATPVLVPMTLAHHPCFNKKKNYEKVSWRKLAEALDVLYS